VRRRMSRKTRDRSHGRTVVASRSPSGGLHQSANRLGFIGFLSGGPACPLWEADFLGSLNSWFRRATQPKGQQDDYQDQQHSKGPDRRRHRNRKLRTPPWGSSQCQSTRELPHIQQWTHHLLVQQWLRWHFLELLQP
jgi:hypothetical protein